MYQLTLVVKSSLKDTERKKLLDGIKESFGKSKITEEEWGQKPLAYPIKKEVSGYFVNWIVDTEELLSSGFEKKMKSQDNVLRYLLLRTKVKKVKAPKEVKEVKVEKPKKTVKAKKK